MSNPTKSFHDAWNNITLPRHWIKRAASKALPAYLIDQLRLELKLLRVRLFGSTSAREFAGQRDLLINIGAGDSGHEGWVNVDGYRGRGITCVADLRGRLPFEDGSARGIFTEHFLEHLDYTSEAPGVLRECHRILKPGGIVRIVVPDAELYLRAYQKGDWTALAAIRPLLDGRTDAHYGWKYSTQIELVNFLFRQGTQHKFAYDYETMEYLLRKCGFSEVRRAAFRESGLPELAIDLEKRASESLYVEAVK